MEKAKKIAGIESRVKALSGLLDAVRDDHFSFSLSGARQYYQRTYHAENEEVQSYWWMNDHFNSLSAAVDAALVIALHIEEDVGALYMDTFKEASA